MNSRVNITDNIALLKRKFCAVIYCSMPWNRAAATVKGKNARINFACIEEVRKSLLSMLSGAVATIPPPRNRNPSAVVAASGIMPARKRSGVPKRYPTVTAEPMRLIISPRMLDKFWNFRPR